MASGSSMEVVLGAAALLLCLITYVFCKLYGSNRRVLSGGLRAVRRTMGTMGTMISQAAIRTRAAVGAEQRAMMMRMMVLSKRQQVLYGNDDTRGIAAQPPEQLTIDVNAGNLASVPEEKQPKHVTAGGNTPVVIKSALCLIGKGVENSSVSSLSGGAHPAVNAASGTVSPRGDSDCDDMDAHHLRLQQQQQPQQQQQQQRHHSRQLRRGSSSSLGAATRVAGHGPSSRVPIADMELGHYNSSASNSPLLLMSSHNVQPPRRRGSLRRHHQNADDDLRPRSQPQLVLGAEREQQELSSASSSPASSSSSSSSVQHPHAVPSNSDREASSSS
eukprot:TRINITY_DN67102_c4_g14_i1.p1 TRINITY_DN67102_c4_g14~~TRINITY_DN67102_c4_g14_i1.p1  ORF type:complete len:331 (+),score=156.23 TRINITY_DN67102_c4_g14_i1:208-1200(+)